MKKTELSLLLVVLLSSSTFAKNVELEKITITTPTKSEQSLLNTTANVDVITSQQLEMRGYKTLGEALSTISGIQVSQNGGFGQSNSIKIRGFDSKRVLVLVDGIRYNNPTSLSGAQFSDLLTSNIEQIEIVKGPQSGIWGADASAGVINIITKKATQDGFRASINGEYGTYNTQKYGLNTSYKQDFFDISLNLQRLTSDGFSAQVPKGELAKNYEDDGYENSSADIRVGLNISKKDRVELFYNIIDSKTDFDGWNAPDDKNETAESKEQFFGVSYSRNADNYKTKLYLNRSKFERYYPNSFYTKNFDGNVDEAGFNGEFNYLGSSVFGGGFDYKVFNHDNEISKDYTNEGVFLTNTNLFNEKRTTFTQNVRYDKFDTFDNKLTYKIGLKHDHVKIEDFVASVNYATAYNVPTLYHLYDATYGNAGLNAEQTVGFDVTLDYKGIGITYFSNEIDEMIDYDFATSKYNNIKGKSKLSGVEISHSNFIDFAGLAYGLNYTYLKAEDANGKKLANRPKDSANLSLDYYGVESLHIGTLIRYVGKRDKQSSYTIVDITTAVDVSDRLNIYAKMDNALRKQYQDISGYGTNLLAFYLGFRYKM